MTTPVKIKSLKDLIAMMSKSRLYRRKGKEFFTRKKIRCETMSGFKKFPTLEVDLKDFTASFAQVGWSSRSMLVFLTHVYENGFLLGFRTGNPCGTCNDQDQSWVVVNTHTGKEEAEFEIKSYGFWHEGIKEQKKEWKEKYGKTFTIKNEFGDRAWKISEQ